MPSPAPKIILSSRAQQNRSLASDTAESRDLLAAGTTVSARRLPIFGNRLASKPDSRAQDDKRIQGRCGFARENFAPGGPGQ